MLLNHFSFLNLAYLVACRPFKSRGQNMVEIFNEFTYLLSSLVVVTFLNAGASDSFRFVSGWLLLGVAGLSMCINIAIVGYSTLFEIIKQLYSRR